MIERHEMIREILEARGSADVEELSSTLKVSPVTIRKDLRILERRGVILRTHGGAIVNSLNSLGASFLAKMRRNLLEKRKIAGAAIGMLSDQETIILCDGTTTYQIAKLLKRSGLRLRVITNALNIALELAQVNNIETIIIGGRVSEYYSIGGYLGELIVENIKREVGLIDRAFLGADGISLEYGLTSFNEQDASINGEISRVAGETIAVLDHTKFNRARFYPIVPLERVNCIITDDGISEEDVAPYRERGIRVILASDTSVRVV
ncbi:MAG: DeoR/GlpR family DNA-binding transcription regulator [bacterium]